MNGVLLGSYYLEFIQALHGKNNLLVILTQPKQHFKGCLWIASKALFEKIFWEYWGEEFKDYKQSLWLYCGGCGARRHDHELDPDTKLCPACIRERRLKVAAVDGNIRRTRELLAWGSHTEKEWQELLESTGRKCLRCERTDRKLTKDHIQPLSRNGTHHISNIQPLCGPCNSWKGTRTINFRDHRIQIHPALPSLDVVSHSGSWGGIERSSLDDRQAGPPSVDRSGLGDCNWLVESDQMLTLKPPDRTDCEDALETSCEPVC